MVGRHWRLPAPTGTAAREPGLAIGSAPMPLSSPWWRRPRRTTTRRMNICCSTTSIAGSRTSAACSWRPKRYRLGAPAILPDRRLRGGAGQASCAYSLQVGAGLVAGDDVGVLGVHVEQIDQVTRVAAVVTA